MSKPIDYTATWGACEAHDEPGECTEECLSLTFAMSGDGGGEAMIYGDYLGGESSIDWSGTHGAAPMPAVRFDLTEGMVVASYAHPEDCQCGDEKCPAMLADLA